MPYFNLLPKIRNLILFTPTLIIKFSINVYDAFYYCTFLVRFFTTVDNAYRKKKARPFVLHVEGLVFESLS